MSYHFLVVDRSATTRALVKRAVRATGLSAPLVYDAADAREALDLLAVHRVDLALIDPALPGGDGEAVIGQVITEPATRGTRVIVITAEPDMRQIERLRRAGAKGWLRKPFSPDALRELATRILEPTHVY